MVFVGETTNSPKLITGFIKSVGVPYKYQFLSTIWYVEFDGELEKHIEDTLSILFDKLFMRITINDA